MTPCQCCTCAHQLDGCRYEAPDELHAEVWADWVLEWAERGVRHVDADLCPPADAPECPVREER